MKACIQLAKVYGGVGVAEAAGVVVFAAGAVVFAAGAVVRLMEVAASAVQFIAFAFDFGGGEIGAAVIVGAVGADSTRGTGGAIANSELFHFWKNVDTLDQDVRCLRGIFRRIMAEIAASSDRSLER